MLETLALGDKEYLKTWKRNTEIVGNADSILGMVQLALRRAVMFLHIPLLQRSMEIITRLL